MKEPFSEFARVYDRFMHYIDYPGWVRYICRITELYKINGKRLLDLACGTGTCAILFAKRGFEVTGVDVSPSMLAQAERKIRDGGYRISLLRQDMRDLQVTERVNIITCLYDSLNYLLRIEDIEKTFLHAYDALEHGGAFIFDMNTEYALKVIWGTNVWYRNEGGVPSVWKNEYDAGAKIGTLYLTWTTIEDGRKEEHFEIHRERAYSNEEIRGALDKAGFGKIAIYAHPTFQAPAEVTPRIMVVAIK